MTKSITIDLYAHLYPLTASNVYTLSTRRVYVSILLLQCTIATLFLHSMTGSFSAHALHVQIPARLQLAKDGV